MQRKRFFSILLILLAISIAGMIFSPMTGRVIDDRAFNITVANATIICKMFHFVPEKIFLNTTAFTKVLVRNCGNQNFTASTSITYRQPNGSVTNTTSSGYSLSRLQEKFVEGMFFANYSVYAPGNYTVASITDYSNSFTSGSIEINATFEVLNVTIEHTNVSVEVVTEVIVAAVGGDGGGGGGGGTQIEAQKGPPRLAGKLKIITQKDILNATKGTQMLFTVTFENTGEGIIDNISIIPRLPFPGNFTPAYVDLLEPGRIVFRQIGIMPDAGAAEQLYFVPSDIYVDGKFLQEVAVVVEVKPSTPYFKRIEIIEYPFVAGFFSGEDKTINFLVNNTGTLAVGDIKGSLENFEGCIAAPSFSGIESLEPGKAGEMAFTAEALAVEKACNATLVVSGEGASDIKLIRLDVRERPAFHEDILNSVAALLKWLAAQIAEFIGNIWKFIISIFGLK